MGEASNISLQAIGKQDTYLLSDKDEELPFLPKDKMHSEFIKYHRIRNVTNPNKTTGWPFGSKIKLEFKPQNMGDLLSNMWLSVKLPKLEIDYKNEVEVTTSTQSSVFLDTITSTSNVISRDRILESDIVPDDPGLITYSKKIDTIGQFTETLEPTTTSQFLRVETTGPTTSTFTSVNQTYSPESFQETTNSSSTVNITINPFVTSTTLSSNILYQPNTTIPSTVTIDTFNTPTNDQYNIYFEDGVDIEPYKSSESLFGFNMVVSPTGYKYFVPNITERTCTVYGLNSDYTDVAKEAILKIYSENGLSNGEKYRLKSNGFGDVIVAARRYKHTVRYIQESNGQLLANLGANFVVTGYRHGFVWFPVYKKPSKNNEILVNSYNHKTSQWSSEPTLLSPSSVIRPYYDFGHDIAISSDGLTIACGTVFPGYYDSNMVYTYFGSYQISNTPASGDYTPQPNNNNIVIFKYTNGEWLQDSVISIIQSLQSTRRDITFFKPALNKDGTRLAVSYYSMVVDTYSGYEVTTSTQTVPPPPGSSFSGPTSVEYNQGSALRQLPGLKVYDYDSTTQSWVEDTNITSILPTTTGSGSSSVPQVIPSLRSDEDMFGMFISMDSTGKSVAVGAPYHEFTTTAGTYTKFGNLHFFRQGGYEPLVLNTTDTWRYEPIRLFKYPETYFGSNPWASSIVHTEYSTSRHLGTNITVCGRGFFALSAFNSKYPAGLVSSGALTNTPSPMYYAWILDNTPIPFSGASGTATSVYSVKDQSAGTNVNVGSDGVIYISKFLFGDSLPTSFTIDPNNDPDFGAVNANFDKLKDVDDVVSTINTTTTERYESVTNKTYTVNDVALLTNYADQVGRHIFKNITMYVDEIEVEKIFDDWCIINDELYIEMSEKVTNAYLLNRNLRYDQSPYAEFSELSRYESELMIPIPFFFSRKFTNDEYKINEPNRPYFPLSSIHKQKIEFEIEFHDQAFFTDSYRSISLSEFDIITEEITVSDAERLYMRSNPMEIVTDFIKKHPTITTDLGINFIKNNLTPVIPVKTFHWFFRREEFENEKQSRQTIDIQQEQAYFQNRFNFSTSPFFDIGQSFFSHVMKKAYFYLLGNKLPNITDANYNYYKYKVPLDARYTRPLRNIYTYTFAMRPMNVNPSGILNFDNLQSNKTTIENELADTGNVYSMHMYYTGYQTMRFVDGFMSFV